LTQKFVNIVSLGTTLERVYKFPLNDGTNSATCL